MTLVSLFVCFFAFFFFFWLVSYQIIKYLIRIIWLKNCSCFWMIVLQRKPLIIMRSACRSLYHSLVIL